ncbi:MAG TPA: DUF3667 domain-containing protein [Agriterribacter sp.]|nr:DUF3667 domain-containing protein [Agriterribacter sp.]
MEEKYKIKKCNSCGYSGTGNYCGNCGQAFKIKRITISTLLQDIFHLFTHFDKGFGYTLKQLIIAPGRMQRTFIKGDRSRHQKPFSMFFICATFSALCRYWLLNVYHESNTAEVTFFREYMVFLHIALIPLYALIANLFFYRSGYNYAEMGVLLLYTLSLLFIVAPFVFLLKFIWPHLDTAYIEFPFFSVYFIITFINFFNRTPWRKVTLLSLLIILIAFIINQLAEGLAIKLI